MQPTSKLLGIGLVVLLVTSGLAAAAGGFGPGVQATDGERTTAGQGAGPVADAQRAADGQHSPWVTGDDRLERFQERFGLTDAQLAQVRAQVTAMLEDGADPAAVHAQVRTMLQAFGVDDPQLGPVDGRGPGLGFVGDGPRGHGGHQGGAGMNHQGGAGMNHQGGPGTGPHGPGDGSCMA